MKKNISFLVVTLLSVFCTAAISQTIEDFSTDNANTLVNTNVNLRLKINRNMQTTLNCGFTIDYGNGEIKEYVAGLNGNSDENMVISYQFKLPGTYQVSVDGKFPITDVKLLAKALSVPPMCWGSKRTISITVADGAPKKLAPPQDDDEVKKLKEKIAKLEAARSNSPEPKKAAPAPSNAPTPAAKPAKANADSIL